MNRFQFSSLVVIFFLLPSLLPAQRITSTMHEVVSDTSIIKLPWHPVWNSRAIALPKYVDNSKEKYFPPIINQKGGSCAQASGIGYMFTYEMNRLLNRDASESDNNRFSYLYTWNFLNSGEDQGGFVDEGLNIAVKYGVMTEADYGYASAYQFKWASGYEKYVNAMRYRGKEMFEFDSSTPEGITRIKEYLFKKNDDKNGGGVLTFSTMTHRWTFDNNYNGPSESGYHAMLTGLGDDGAHSMTIAGYDDTVEYVDSGGKKHYGAFIVVNSWGTSMHDQGRFYFPYYFFLSRDSKVTETILSSTLTGIDVCMHEPKLVFRIGLEYSSRNDISLTYGSSDKVSSTYPQSRYMPVVFLNQGGDYPMNGAYGGEGIFEFAIDYTEQLPSADYLHPKYFMNIIRSERGNKSGTGKINYLSLLDYRTKGGPKEYRCKEAEGVSLGLGDNLFSIATRPLMTVSANPVRWMKDGKIDTKCTYIIRSATGKFAKMKLVGYDKKTGKVTMQYLYQPDGTRNLSK